MSPHNRPAFMYTASAVKAAAARGIKVPKNQIITPDSQAARQTAENERRANSLRELHDYFVRMANSVACPEQRARAIRAAEATLELIKS